MHNELFLYPFPYPKYVNVRRNNYYHDVNNWISHKARCLTNTANTPQKFYSIYAPPNHPFGTVHEKKADAEEGGGRRYRYAGRNRATNSTNAKTAFTKEEAAAIALLLGIDFNKVKFDLDEFWMGVNTELEHGRKYYQTNVTADDPIITGKIALAHLSEFPDYYKRLMKLEEEAKAYWNK